MQKVLVVEDSIVVNKHIATLLENNGMEVRSAFNSADAVTELSDFKPDLILLDIMMEKSDSGLEFARSLEIKNQGTPVIFLTALTDAKTLAQIKDVSPYGYITKPFNEVELVTNIEVAIAKNRAEQELRQSYEYHESVFNVLGSVVIVCDEKMKIINFNQTLLSLMDESSQEYFKIQFDDAFSFFEYPDRRKVNDLTSLTSESFYYLEISHPEKNKTTQLVITDYRKQSIKTNSGSFEVMMMSEASEKIEKIELEERLRVQDLSQLVHGQELERRRISAELHDNLSQVLNSAKLALQTHKNEYAIDMLNHALEESRRISENLLPAKLVDFPIQKSISSYLNKLKGVVDFNIDFYADDVPLIKDELVKIHLFRILQEAAGNAMKYSKCNQLTVQLMQIDDELIFSVEDDGKGFDLRENIVKESNGLKNMEYRAKLLNSELEIDSAMGKGTFVSVKIPLATFENENSIN